LRLPQTSGIEHALQSGAAVARSFQDANFLVWEAFATTGKHGFNTQPNITFQCVTTPSLRPRTISVNGDEADAQTLVLNSTDADLLALFNRSTELS
jgi:hypothetical protein